jgi:erythromycin esterase
MTPIILLLATLLTPHTSNDYDVALRRGESAEVIVHQHGIDVIVELRSPHGALLDAVDGPTGREGDERVEIIATESGRYRIHVRPFDANETSGTYTVEVNQRTAAATRTLLQTRRHARDLASAWLRERTAPLASANLIAFDNLAERSRVVGLGEATHGSREFGDARLSLTLRLIERDGYRLVAVEASASRLAALAPYVSGDAAVADMGETTWIGVRTRRQLIERLRAFNLAHPSDRVRLIGVDPQDNVLAHATLSAFLKQAYGADLLLRWRAAEKELVAADEQTAVFGDSSVKAEVRQFLVELQSMIERDAPLLRPRFGAAVDDALEAARTLTAFADFNSGAPDTRSRDWHMAAAVMRALNNQRAVYWAHNAHVAARGQNAGALLRSALGCNYAAMAMTFGAGSFVAQIPNDADDRLVVSTLPQAPNESIESVLAPIGGSASIALWPCGVDAASAPEWLRVPHAMHWIGALWAPDSLPSAAFHPYDLLHDFDGIVYFANVAAEDVPANRPHIPSRVR